MSTATTPTPNTAAQGVSLVNAVQQMNEMSAKFADFMARMGQSEPVTPVAAPTAAPKPTGMVTRGKGRTLHTAHAVPVATPVRARKLALPAAAKVGKAETSEAFDPIAYYGLDCILPLSDDGKQYMGISTQEKYFGNIVLVGFTRRAQSFNPRTFRALASLDWSAMEQHALECLPAEVFGQQ